MTQEHILGVAIQYEGKVYMALRPCRHHHVIRQIAQANGVGIKGPDVQGFFTNAMRFVDRREALQIALAAGQVIDPQAVRGDRLYSEDLW